MSFTGEIIGVEIKLRHDKLLLVVLCYRAPNDTSFVDDLKSVIEATSENKYFTVLILGSFNSPSIRWIEGSGFVKSDSGMPHDFFNLLSYSFLYQLVESPTRDQNILDLVLSNNPDVIGNISVDLYGLPSDHKSIYFEFSLSPMMINTPVNMVYDYKNADFDSLRDYLSSKTIDLTCGDNVDIGLQTWKTHVLETVNSFVPKRKQKKSTRASWINCDIAYAIKKKNFFWRKKARGSTDSDVIKEFPRMRQRKKNWIRASRKAYLGFIASEIYSNAKPFWSFLRPNPNVVRYLIRRYMMTTMK